MAGIAAALAIGAGLAGAQGQTTEGWAPFELCFDGPATDEEADAPNPFLDYRLQVQFVAPSGAVWDVPGFYAGDSEGSGLGGVWKARLLPVELGPWSYTASFRTGDEVAVELSPTAGVPTGFDGETGSFLVVPPTSPEGFQARGKLEYVGAHRLRFTDGSWFLKTGADSPENFFAFDGFDGVMDLGGLPSGVVHRYEPHVADWRPGDPAVGAAGSSNGLKGIIGALNYLSEEGVNSVYFLPLNLGGDGQDTTPHLTYEDTIYAKTHFDVSRLEQWDTVLDHAMRRGIQAQFVLSETEPANEGWLDNGQLGTQRKLFFRELIARFAHHNAVKWNLGEESDWGIATLRDMATYIDALDAYDNPITVHTRADDFSDYEVLVGDPLFDITSIQYSNDLAGQYVEEWRQRSADAGHPWVLDMDENGTPQDGLSDTNATELRKEVLYDVLFSGGGIEWYVGSKPLPLGGDVSVEDFRTREEMWRYSRHARGVLEDGFPHWDMEPDDERLIWESPDYGGAEVFAASDGSAVCYLPSTTDGGALDLSGFDATSRFLMRWYDPRTGKDSGLPWVESGGGPVSLPAPPAMPGEDWVLTVRRLALYADMQVVSVGSGVQQLTLDGGPDKAFYLYQVLTSFTGVQPGTPYGDVLLPLNWDFLTTASFLNPGNFGVGLVGILDADGRATAQMNLAAELGPEHVGLSLAHAYLAGPIGAAGPTFASNAIPMTMAP